VGLLRRIRLRLGRGIDRPVTLLRIFLFASAVILVAGGLVLGSVLTGTLRSQTLAMERTSLTEYVDGVLGPVVVRRNQVVTTHWVSQTILHAIRKQPDVVSVKVWRADGTLAWTSLEPGRIGKRFELDGDLGEAIRENRAVAGIISPDSEGEDEVESRLGFKHLIQVYAPLEDASRSRAIGAYEIYANPAHLQQLIGKRVLTIWLTVGGVFATLWLALALLVRGASRTLRLRTVQLRDRSARLAESYRLLEQSALEAIESLNAAVDAKDPYTAGHSQRVQELALAIGRKLGLPSEELDTLGIAGLFHDIGKLRVPDAILTKPGPLTPEEFALIKRHPEDGVAIVGHLGRMRDAVPFIRHHHERWDGRGYPLGLAGDAIPVGAAIVGLADAWDAMTTERPYSRARSLHDAAQEIARGRGTQFAPAVVDAFLATVEHERPPLAATG
jgi:putative nucleotidyltransferase with HDIG domain